ncbi:MAG: acyltransferase family protein [Candidatus Latescibacteria bacterium]|nr:acyltransferase family protein [Candidatus Latescibacterota bacterium]
MTQNGRSQPRILFIDNMRYIIIAFVILQHVALIYGAHSEGSVLVQNMSQFIVMITDVFMMPILFFAAGFFALPSIRSKGTWGFMVSKWKRIWIPWLIGVLFVLPPAVYLMYYIRSCYDGASHTGYWQYWVNFMKSAAEFHTGYTRSADQFSHRHLWFLSVLFPLFILFAIICKIKVSWSGNIAAEKMDKIHTTKTIFRAIVLTGALAAVGFFIAKLFYPWGYRAILVASLIHFEPTRLVFYIIYFALGIYAFSGKWFTGDNFPHSFTIWIPVCLASLGIFTYFGFAQIQMPSVAETFLNSFVRSFLCLSLFMVLVTLTSKYRNKPSIMDQSLASNSYTIYIIHYPFHVMFAALLLRWNGRILVKFWVVYIATCILSYLISNYVVKPHPRLSALGIVLVNIILFIVF